jgi:hypothetical protein
MNFVITTPSTTAKQPSSKVKVNARLVSPGEVICEAEGFLRGHGMVFISVAILSDLTSQGHTLKATRSTPQSLASWRQ